MSRSLKGWSLLLPHIVLHSDRAHWEDILPTAITSTSLPFLLARRGGVVVPPLMLLGPAQIHVLRPTQRGRLGALFRVGKALGA